MGEAIIVALITAAASVVCEVIISSTARHKAEIETAKREQKLNDRLDAIETKLEIHNGYAEKFGEIAIKITEIGKDIEYLKKKGE